MNDPYLELLGDGDEAHCRDYEERNRLVHLESQVAFGRSYPAMRQGILTDFDEVYVDDLGGESRGEGGGASDESIFKTSTASGVRVGTAIVTAVRLPDSTEEDCESHSDDPAIALVSTRTITGSAQAKRESLLAYCHGDIDDDMKRRMTSQKERWKISGAVDSDRWTSLDGYFNYLNSGVQPVREAALTDYDRNVLEQRMNDYFDPDIEWEEIAKRYPQFDLAHQRYDGRGVRAAHDRTQRSGRKTWTRHQAAGPMPVGVP